MEHLQQYTDMLKLAGAVFLFCAVLMGWAASR
jgi:hypothetical protein